MGSKYQIFWPLQIWGQKVFRIFSFNKCSGLWIFQGGDWLRDQHFLVMLNLRSKIFQNFFIYRALWTLNFLEGGVWVPTFFVEGIGPGTNIFWSCEIWGEKFFKFFSFTNHSRFWIYQGRRVVWSNFFWSCQIWDQNFSELFYIQSTVDSEFVWGGQGGESGHWVFGLFQIWG